MYLKTKHKSVNQVKSDLVDKLSHFVNQVDLAWLTNSAILSTKSDGLVDKKEGAAPPPQPPFWMTDHGTEN